MNIKQTTSLSAAVLAASLAMGTPTMAVAQQSAETGQANQQASSGTRTIMVGHNVVDAVDDVRETTADFIGALLTAEEGRGIANWDQQEQRLNQIEKELEQMETMLDQKAESTDQEWLDWMGGPEYSVNVTDQIRTLGSHLEQVSGILEENWNTRGIQMLVGSNVLEQLRDLRETTGDLLTALEGAGSDYGWTTDPERMKQSSERLAKMSRDIDQLLMLTDEGWQNYLESDRFHVVIYDNVATLAEVLQNVTEPGQR
ncbi:hypothetical protein [Halopseudomonas sp.]|uniref:hypothetical protein n=1 Tax=Halopseudomonas sp. TaxID=2901191 RepID=UPI001A585C4F|nr:hypothetical protein [Pseudomonas sp.]